MKRMESVGIMVMGCSCRINIVVYESLLLIQLFDNVNIRISHQCSNGK